jgi:hypothetical protein
MVKDSGNRLVKKTRLTPIMIAKVFGVHMGEGSKRRDPSENGTRGVGLPERKPLAVIEARTGSKRSKRMPSASIGLVVIGMMMVAIGVLLFFPINLSLEHARIIGGFGFFVVGVSVIYSVVANAHLSNDGTQQSN